MVVQLQYCQLCLLVVLPLVTPLDAIWCVPLQGSVLGPEEFFQGLGIGLRSFLGAGVVGEFSEWWRNRDVLMVLVYNGGVNSFVH